MYIVEAIYKGYSQSSSDNDLDSRLEKSVGKRSQGAGFLFYANRRDITWEFRSEEKANIAARKLKRFKAVISVRLWKEQI